MLHYRFLPVEKNGNNLIVGMVNPDDVEGREALKFISVKNGFIPDVYVILNSDFENVSQKYRNLGKEVTSAIEQLNKELTDDVEGLSGEDITTEKVEQLAAEAPYYKSCGSYVALRS